MSTIFEGFLKLNFQLKLIMKKEEKIHNQCSKFKSTVKEENLCDYYEGKKNKCKIRCKNCIHFSNSSIIGSEKT